MIMINGVGFTYYGIKNPVYSASEEEFDTTRWFCLLWIPIFPIGSYRIRRKRRDSIGVIARVFWSSKTIQYAKRPLDWKQIGKIYLCVYGVLGLLVGAMILENGIAKKTEARANAEFRENYKRLHQP